MEIMRSKTINTRLIKYYVNKVVTCQQYASMLRYIDDDSFVKNI